MSHLNYFIFFNIWTVQKCKPCTENSHSNKKAKSVSDHCHYSILKYYLAHHFLVLHYSWVSHILILCGKFKAFYRCQSLSWQLMTTVQFNRSHYLFPSSFRKWVIINKFKYMSFCSFSFRGTIHFLSSWGVVNHCR